MKISHFHGARDKCPKQLEFDWYYFTQNFGPHDFSWAVKEEVPCFSPAEYLDVPPDWPEEDWPDWGKRLKENVQRVWMFVLDIDEVTEEVYRWLVERVQAMGLAAMIYSTWSHAAAITTKGRWKFRIVVPLDQPVPAERWLEFWVRANSLFGGYCDERCKDASRLYFGAFAPAGTEHLNFFYVIQGGTLAIDQVFALPLPDGVRDTRLVEQANLRQNLTDATVILAAAWPWNRRHEAHLALAGGLLKSGLSDDQAIEFLCSVAAGQDANNSDRPKRESIVSHTREQLDANNNVTGWTTLASIVGYDVVEKVRALVEKAPDLDREQLRRYAKQLQRSKIDQKAELGDALQRVYDGNVFPDAVALKLAAELGARFVDYDPKSIAREFAASLALMSQTAGETVSVEQVEARIKLKQDEVRRQRDETKKRSEEQKQAIDQDRSNRIRESFNNGRSHPYDASELRLYAPVIQTGHQWILQKDRAYYFFHSGAFRGPYTESEAHNAALRELAPAASAGVEIYKVLKDGGTDFKSLRQLVAEYGSVADELVLDMRMQATTYDPYTRTIVEAPCPLRPIRPVYHPDIDEWLYHLAGDSFWHDLKTWLAILPRLDIVRVALFLTGEKSVGKSLLALGCARLWTTRGPTALEAAFGTFNDIVASCPLCFADEQLPKDFRGYTMNPQLRHHIQATERTYKRKFLPNGKLIGVTPTIVAAHDPSILRTPEELSNNEIEGIMERYFHVAVRPDAGHYLRNLRPTTFERGWVEQDKIAEFVMWLYYNHQHESQGRFYINRPDVENTRWLATSSGARSAVLRWLCSYLADRKLFEGDANTLMHVRIYQGRLLVNIKALLKFWDKYIGNEKCPTSGKLAQTIGELSHPHRVQLRDGKGVQTNYRVINEENLFAWAKNSDFITEEKIREELLMDSRQTSVGLIKSV